jgi:hypothetical protein
MMKEWFWFKGTLDDCTIAQSLLLIIILLLQLLQARIPVQSHLAQLSLAWLGGAELGSA